MTDLDTNEPIRGPEAVRKSLIEAAVQLMAMRSPRQISGRELAKHAGVNYGLIHHYFGSKDAVFAEAVAVATEEMGERWDSDGILPVNTSDDAASYRTFAKLELDEARSPMTDLIHRIVRGQATATGRAEDDPICSPRSRCAPRSSSVGVRSRRRSSLGSTSSASTATHYARRSPNSPCGSATGDRNRLDEGPLRGGRRRLPRIHIGAPRYRDRHGTAGIRRDP